MFLREIDQGGTPAVQGFVKVQWPPGDPLRASQVRAWARFFIRSTLLWSQVLPLSAAIRIAAQPGQPLTSVHSLVVPKTQEARLRLVLAAFMRTDGMGGAATEAPQQGGDLEGEFRHSGDPRVAIGYEPLRTPEGVGIHYNLRLADNLIRIIQTFADLGIAIAYEAQAAPWSPPRELLRQALYDASHLQDQEGVPQDLLRDQDQLSRRLKRAAQQRTAYHVEECLAGIGGIDVEALREPLSNLLSETVYGSFGAAPEAIPVAQDRAEAFAGHVHSHVLRGPPTVFGSGDISAAAVKEDLDRLLSCRALEIDRAGTSGEAGEAPGGEPLFTSLTGPRGPGGGAAPSGGPAPGLGGDGRPYVFISYARKDADIVYPLLERLAEQGVSAWFDRTILGGEDWLAELEARLIDCSGVVAFLSPSFVSSKYCAREVHFADALNRPIIPVFIVPGTDLQRGLRFLLHPSQQIMFHKTKSTEEIVSAVKRHAPRTVAGAAP